MDQKRFFFTRSSDESNALQSASTAQAATLAATTPALLLQRQKISNLVVAASGKHKIHCYSYDIPCHTYFHIKLTHGPSHPKPHSQLVFISSKDHNITRSANLGHLNPPRCTCATLLRWRGQTPLPLALNRSAFR